MIDVELSETLYDFISKDEFNLVCEREEMYFSEKELLLEVKDLGF